MDVQLANRPSAARGSLTLEEDIMLHANTIAKGALFNVQANDRKVNGPAMTGNFEVNSERINVSGYLKVARESGKDYLNLKIGEKSGPVFYGKLFRNVDKKGEKSPDYSGYVELGIGNDAPQLRVAGWRMKSRDQQTPYISLELAPPMKNADSDGSEGEGDELPL